MTKLQHNPENPIGEYIALQPEQRDRAGGKPTQPDPSPKEQLLEAAAAATPAGVLITDDKGRLVFANEACRAIAKRLGWTMPETGEPVSELSWPLEEEAEMGSGEGRLARAPHGEGTVTLLALPAAEGGDTYIRYTTHPLRDNKGHIIGAALSFWDVSPWIEAQREARDLAATLQKANEQLRTSAAAAQAAAQREQAARKKAEAAVQERDAFLAAAAHELKTPVTNLRGFAQLALRQLSQGQVAETTRIRRALEVIDRQANRLARLIGQLLDAWIIEGEGLQLYRQETDVAALVQRVVAAAQVEVSRNRFVVHAPQNISAFVDPQRLEQVLANLLDNARKHSPPDAPIEIEVSAPDPQTVRIAVRDHGPGIAPEERQHLFERFGQAHRGAPYAGLGLGLYVSRHIVEHHGGRIWAEFPQDGGSRFVLTLPRTPGT